MRLSRLGVYGLVAASGLWGCRTVDLASDPLTSSPTVLAPDVFRVDWWKSLTGQVKLLEHAPREPAAPAVDQARQQVITVTRDGTVRAIGIDGELRWEHETKTFFSAGAGVSAQAIYVPGGNGELVALDPETGATLWSYATKEELGSAPIEHDGLVLVASHANSLFAVDAKTGEWKWQYRREAPSGFTLRGISAPTVRNGMVYLGFADGTLSAVRLTDGVALWERTLSTSSGPFIDVDTTPVFDDAGHVFAASLKDGVSSLDPATGRTLWTQPVTGINHLLARGEVLFGTGSGKLVALMAADGKALWSLSLDEDAGGAPVLAGGYLVTPVGSALLFVDPGLGRSVLKWDPGQGVSAAVARGPGSAMYVLSNLGFVYAMELVGSDG